MGGRREEGGGRRLGRWNEEVAERRKMAIWTDGQMDRWIDGQMNRKNVGVKRSHKDGEMDRWTDGQMDRWTGFWIIVKRPSVS